jgi:hypothetical protein
MQIRDPALLSERKLLMNPDPALKMWRRIQQKKTNYADACGQESRRLEKMSKP